MPTRPAREAFRHMDTSGLPFFIQVYSMVVTVATAGAMVVVRKMDARDVLSQAAAPLKPYQPNQRMKQPRAPRVMEWPGMAFTFLTFPSLLLIYLPSLGPTIMAPIRAVTPPTECMAAEPAKSWKPIFTSQPWLFQTHPASMG